MLDPASPQSPASYGSADRPFGSRPVSEEFPKRVQPVGMLEKARAARMAWRRRQKDVKHEKLKSSIRVLGPVDPAISSGFVMRADRGLLDGGVGENRVPGYMTNGIF
jgi:hypothetical protein